MSDFRYLCLNLGGATESGVRSFATHTTAEENSKTGLSAQPQFVLLGLTDCVTEDTEETDADAGGFGIASWTTADQNCNAWAMEDGRTTSPGPVENSQSVSDNQAINFASGDGTAQYAATLTSFDGDGYTLEWTAVDGTARRGFELFIGSEGAMGEGGLDSASGAVSGFGWRDETDIAGALAADGATVAGSAVAGWRGDGALAAADVVIGGGTEVGFAGDVVDWDASGDDVLWDSNDSMLWAPGIGTIPAQGVSKSLGDGDLQRDATLSASGFQPVNFPAGNGNLGAQASQLSAEAVNKSFGEGGLPSQDSVVAGESGAAFFAANGDLASQVAQMMGQATVSGEGAVVSNVAGEAFVLNNSRTPRTRKRRFNN
jgi:hypothetical protein